MARCIRTGRTARMVLRCMQLKLSNGSTPSLEHEASHSPSGLSAGTSVRVHHLLRIYSNYSISRFEFSSQKSQTTPDPPPFQGTTTTAAPNRQSSHRKQTQPQQLRAPPFAHNDPQSQDDKARSGWIDCCINRKHYSLHLKNPRSPITTY